jgi:hypothetical protein
MVNRGISQSGDMNLAKFVVQNFGAYSLHEKPHVINTMVAQTVRQPSLTDGTHLLLHYKL